MRRSIIRSFKGMKPQIASSVYVDPAATIMGDVEIGDNSSIWPQCVLRGDVNRIYIGSRTNIQDACVLHVTHRSESNPHGHPLWVGDEVTVGHRCILHGCTIERRTLIGMGAIVMDGAVVEEGSIVGAGALVTEGTVVKGGWLYLGVPAKPVRELTQQEREDVVKSAFNYVIYAESAYESYIAK